MPARNVNLTEELDQAIGERVRSGRYENASEVVRAALRALADQEALQNARLTSLRLALEHGERSGIVAGNAFAKFWERLGLPPREK
jgi:antitoxin ParD1/3/4